MQGKKMKNRCDQINANVRMEERYAGMSLTFEESSGLRKEIEEAIEKIKKQTGIEPLVFDNSKDQSESSQSLYIEFDDEAQRESGAFFELILKELNIDKCAHDVIEAN